MTHAPCSHRAPRRSARALFSLLYNAPQAIDLLQSALELGLLKNLDQGPKTLEELSAELGQHLGHPIQSERLYKYLDCLESLGLVGRAQSSDDIQEARYTSLEPLEASALEVFGPESMEADRQKFPWQALSGRLPDVLTGKVSLSEEQFAWPPKTQEQVAAFERSMAVGIEPFCQAFSQHREHLFGTSHGSTLRWLDVGGGDGTLTARLTAQVEHLQAAVFNLPSTEDVVHACFKRSRCPERLQFLAGDFFAESLPTGFDVLSFVRVLHDWPAERSRQLVQKAHEALAPGTVLLISEELRNEERLARQFFWTYFLMGTDRCTSRLREVEYYEQLLQEEGFGEVQVLPGPMEILRAVRLS